MKNLVIIITVVINIIFNSCDSPTINVNNDKKNYLPLELGNYWIYDNYEVEYNGNIISGSRYEDSVVVEFQSQYKGKLSYFLIKYRDQKPYDTLHVNFSNNQVWLYLNTEQAYQKSAMGKWFAVCDFFIETKESWNVGNDLINNIPFMFEGLVYPANFLYTINGSIEYVDSIDFSGRRYLTKKFLNKYDSKLNFSMVNKIDLPGGGYRYDTTKVTGLHKYFDHYHLIEGIGFYKIRHDPNMSTITTEPSSTMSRTDYYQGSESVLLRYGGKK